MTNERFAATWRIQAGKGRDAGIGIVGCGAIVAQNHLPAYREAGLRVAAVFDTDMERARLVAREFGIPIVADSAKALVEAEGVDIVDIAVPPWVQPEIVALAVAAGRHVLCQKPFALEMEQARQMVEAADSAGVLLAVNQQMRWIAGIIASRDLLAQGAIGHATGAHLQVSGQADWSQWPWLAAAPRLEVMFHSIHYLDVVRSVLGDPEWVTSIHGRLHGQSSVEGETLTTTVLEYSDGLQALITMNLGDQHGTPINEFRFLGTSGSLDGTIAEECGADASHDTLALRRAGVAPTIYDFDTCWFPDAFLGPMSDLMDAIGTGRAPQTSGRDNLRTLALVFGAYRSAEERASIRVADVLSE